MQILMILFLGSITSIVGCDPGVKQGATSVQTSPGATGDTSLLAPRRRTLSLDGVKLSILEAGTGDPVMYVHGVVTTSNIFPKYLAAYSPSFRGIAVDLRGYGDSEKTPAGSNIDQFVTDLIHLA